MGFWDREEIAENRRGKGMRRDVSKFGIVRSKHPSYAGKMFIPAGIATPGSRVRFVDTPNGMAFKFGAEGDYKVYIQNGGTEILITGLPPSMNRYAPEKVCSIEVEDFKGGYLIRYDQFK